MYCFKKTISLFTLIITIISLNFQDISAKTDTLESAIKKFSQTQNTYRITVADFKNSSGQKTKYDIYIADTILHELGKYKKFKLIERKKLYTVLNELKLTGSGIINPKEALKIGNMLPVDLICTGSYTIINSKIKINARFINVVSGEIIKTLAFNFEKDDNLAQKPDSKIPQSKSKCARLKDEVNNNLKNLNGKERVDKVVESATKIPFDLECGMIHFKVIKIFKKYDIYHQKYKQFLMKTLPMITDYSKDKRTLKILSYLRLDEKISDDEWNAYLKIIVGLGKGQFHTYLRLLLKNKKDSIESVNKRIDTICKLTEQKKIGLPIAFNSDFIFFTILGNLRDFKNKKIINILHLFKNYSQLLPDDKSHNASLFYAIKRQYFLNDEKEVQNKIIELLINNFKNRTPSAGTAKSICLFAEKIEKRIKIKTDKKKYKKQLKLINNNLKKWFCFYKANPSTSFVKMDIDAYLKRNQLICK